MDVEAFEQEGGSVMDELVRRAAMEGRLMGVYRMMPDEPSRLVGHVVCDRAYRHNAPFPGNLVLRPIQGGALASPDRSLLRRAMREEWKLAD